MKIITTLFLFAMSFNALSQTTIKGVVKDDMGPLSGASIIIKNSNKGVISNIEGVYEIKAKPTDTLSISYLGYQVKDVLIGNRRSINIFLTGNIKLDEVVVVSYGSCKKTYCTTCRCGVTVKYVTTKNFKSDLITPTLYPNPSKEGRFKLALFDNYKNIHIQVSNISGQIIKTQNYLNINKRLNIDLSQLPLGIYIINIIADGKQLPAKKAVIGG
ncbi:carboxypeptidase-like regulatory domain-containing protein [Thalassobellus sediminis]|uniref:carboxypeptidase-like regulatory domain-containing protein n=1 Tax=Thalassobellus sediminis TaxID=3367753 RepID=UPI0037B79E47